MIAVLPYVTHPKTAVLGRAGGGQFLDDASSLLHPSWTRQTKKSEGGVDDGSAAVQS